MWRRAIQGERAAGQRRVRLARRVVARTNGGRTLSPPHARPARLRRNLLGRGSGLCAPLAHRREKLSALFEQPLALLARTHHLAHRLENIAGAKVETAVEALDRAVDLVVTQPRIFDRALLVARLVEQRIER